MDVPARKAHPQYFATIYSVLPCSQPYRLRIDIQFLVMFSEWLESWDDILPSDADDDESSRERLSSILISFKLTWPDTLKAFSLSKRSWKSRSTKEEYDSWDQEFQLASIELEANIQQTKRLILGCNLDFFMLSSSRYKPSWNFRDSRAFFANLWFGSIKGYFADINIDILYGKISFIRECLRKIHDEKFEDEKHLAPFLNFILHFANAAAFLTSLYWAKNADGEEIATKMNNLIFDLMQKFIPCIFDILPFYINILESSALHPCHSILVREAVDASVDFFFGHLHTVISKDDFLILRNRLIFLFTFLFSDPSPPPLEEADETHAIRNQIYTLLLTFDDDTKKEDLSVSDKMMVLRDFMIKIETPAAKARQLYYGSSDPWLKLEIEEIRYTFLSLHKELKRIEQSSSVPVIYQLQLYGMELRCLRVFLLYFATWDDSDKDINMRLRSLILSFQDIWEIQGENSLFAHRLHAMPYGGHITTWHPLASELEEKIQLSKLQIKARWVNSVYWSPLTSYEILKFMDSTIECLNDLLSFKAAHIVSFRKQIETLEEKLVFLRNLFKLATICMHSKELEELKLLVQVFSNDAMCLTFRYWANDTNEISASETNYMLSHMLQKIKPATPHVARLYFEALKPIFVHRSDSLMFGQTACAFIDFLLEDPVIPLKKDFQILRDDIVFLLSFLNDPPPNQNAEQVICKQIEVKFWEGFYGLLPFDYTDGDFCDKKQLLLRDFMMKIDMINVDITRIYGEFLDPSVYDFPKVISPLFLDNLIQDLRNLKERMICDRKYAPFAKYKIIKIEEELVSLRPLFNYIFPLQTELKETWLEVVGFVHITEHTINSCISSWFVFDHPIWYHMARLSDLIDRINVVKTKLEKIKENTLNNEGRLPRSTTIVRTFSEQVAPSKLIETFVGFKDEAEEIRGMLTCEYKPLDIVSIVGMGGLGKTTLAKQVYGSVKGNFDVAAFCTVSQDHNTKRLLADIIRDIMGDDKRWLDLSVDELAHQWKSLSRRKFLIVLDDIWDASAWNEVKSSFPDDKNGSRVMVTTRSREVANKCTINCSPYHLRFMNDVESYELLQRKVFHNVTSPPYLSEVGKQIAKNCKGLPLAVAVIAGLLAKTEKSMSRWSEVAERVFSYLPDEDCMGILELSYKHLPETLKPCLLYLGAFEEDVTIPVKQVILLWIGEGFVEESEAKCIEDVAKEYLQDLLDRNLIIEDRRISNSHLKGIHVHDSIHELCQKKCREANFIQVYHNTAPSSTLDLSIINKIRLSMQSLTDITTVVGSPASIVRSLLSLSDKYEFHCSDVLYRGYRLVQVLHLDRMQSFSRWKQICSLIHLKYLDVDLDISFPQSIFNIWNIRILRLDTHGRPICLPETFWRMNSLRHVKIKNCTLKLYGGHDEHEAYPVLDKVVSFSKPVIFSGKDVQRLLKRLPAVRKLSCQLSIFSSDGEESVEVLDFRSKLESLILTTYKRESRYLINFPSTLKKLTLKCFHLLWADISAIAELHCLEVLKLQQVSFQETRLEMEDLVFRNLRFFYLFDSSLVEWNACTESLPCLETLVIIYCRALGQLPACFGELSTLKGIEIVERYDILSSSAFRIQEEQRELGIKVEVSSRIYTSGY